MKADLHCYTTISDGTLGIEDLMILAKNSGLDKIAITDHDCIASSVRGSMIAKRMDGFDVIIGCEFSATDTETMNMVDILCYLPDSPERLEKLCISNTAIRQRAGRIIAKKASEKFNIPGKYIVSCATGANYISEGHIMRALSNCGMTSELFGELYESLFTRGSKDYIGIKPAFPAVRDVLEEIHGAGGIAIMSAPKEENMGLLEELIDEGVIDGIEVWTPDTSESERAALLKLAKDNGLLATGGSCFHGAFSNKAITIGTECPPADNVAALLSYKSRKNRKKRNTV